MTGELVRTTLITVVLILPMGCASFVQHLPGASAPRLVLEADRLLREGDYAGARATWQQLAKEYPRSDTGERSAYLAAWILVFPKNPSRDYRRAAQEFEAYRKAYPSGTYADEATAWIAAVEALERSQVAELLVKVDDLKKQVEQAAAERSKAKAERDGLAKERDALTLERKKLGNRIEALLQEKKGLLKERTALLRERDNLTTDRIALEKRVASLLRDRERLLAAKAKLEQRLRDVTEVDIRMEKKRRKVK